VLGILGVRDWRPAISWFRIRSRSAEEDVGIWIATECVAVAAGNSVNETVMI